jgi:hypothetical protein
MQNDLSEYFSLLNFANPNFLGSKNDFRKNFENHIIRGRDADASDSIKAESEKKLKELGNLVTKFIIRRTNDLLSKYRTFSFPFPPSILFLKIVRSLQFPSNMNKSYSADYLNSSYPYTVCSYLPLKSKLYYVVQNLNPSRLSIF